MSMVWVGVGTAVVGLWGANKQANAAKQAGQLGADAASAANATQLTMYNQSRSDNEPFRQNALTAQSEYMALLGLQPTQPQAQGSTADPGQAYLMDNPDVAADRYFASNPMAHYAQYGRGEGRQWGVPQTQPAQPAPPAQNQQQSQQAAFDRFRGMPGYQFGLQEGVRSLDASATAAGGLFSGKAGKALTSFGIDYADQQGFSPYMNRLANLAGMGQTANAQNAQAGQNYANQFGVNTQNAAASRQSGLIGGANAWSNFGNNLTNIAGAYAGYRGK